MFDFHKYEKNTCKSHQGHNCPTCIKMTSKKNRNTEAERHFKSTAEINLNEWESLLLQQL